MGPASLGEAQLTATNSITRPSASWGSSAPRENSSNPNLPRGGSGKAPLEFICGAPLQSVL